MGNCNQPSPNLALCLLRLVLISGSLDLTRATRFWLHSFAALEGWGQYPITGAVCCGDIPRYSYTPLTRARLKPTSIHQTNIYALYVCIIYIYVHYVHLYLYIYNIYTCNHMYTYVHVVHIPHKMAVSHLHQLSQRGFAASQHQARSWFWKTGLRMISADY